MSEWIKCPIYPTSHGSSSDPYVMVTDGNFIGIAVFWGDIWEQVEWLCDDMPKPFSEEKYYDQSYGYMENDMVSIKAWRRLPEIPKM